MKKTLAFLCGALLGIASLGLIVPPAVAASLTSDRVDGVSASVAVKAPVRVATTANITLSGTQTIDGVAVVADDRVLVKSQTTASENGIYNVSASAWSRAKDFDGSRDAVTGTLVMVIAGTTNANTYWRISTTGSITIGSTSLAFERALASDSSSISFLQSGTGAQTRGIQDKLRDAVSIKDFGAACDGNDNPLSGYYATLAAAQVVYPHAQALTDSLDWAATQAAINSLSAIGGTVEIDAGTSYCVFNRAINMTNPVANTSKGINLVCKGGARPTLHSILLKHTSHGFDFTGSAGHSMHNCNIGADSGTNPQTAILMARSSTNAGAGLHKFYNLSVWGQYTVAPIVNYGAEEVEFFAPYLANSYSGGAAAVVLLTANNNIAGRTVTSAYECTSPNVPLNCTTLATGNQSNIVHTFHGGSYYMASGHASADVFHLDQASNVRLYGAWMYGSGAASVAQGITGITQANPAVVTYAGSDTYANGDIVYIGGVLGMTEVNDAYYIVANVNTTANTFQLTNVNTAANVNGSGWTAYSSAGTITETAGARALVYVNTTNSTSDNNSFIGITGEQATSKQLHGFYFGDTAKALTGWTIQSMRAPTIKRFLKSATGVTLDNFQIGQINEVHSNGIEVVGTLQKSTVDSADLIVSVGTSTANVYALPRSQLTRTTPSTDTVLDRSLTNEQLQGSATFNPADLADGAGETTTVTVTGAVLGDFAVCAFSLDLQGIVLTGYVSAANTVSCRFQNETTGTLNLAEGTLRARVFKSGAFLDPSKFLPANDASYQAVA